MTTETTTENSERLILTDEEKQSWNNYLKENDIKCSSCLKHQKLEFIRYRRYIYYK